MNFGSELGNLLQAGAGSGLLATWSRILGILLGACLVRYFSMRFIIAFRIRIAARMHDGERVRRAETLGRVIRYLVSVLIFLIAGTLILSEMGISVAPILGAAGVIGLAIGFAFAVMDVGVAYKEDLDAAMQTMRDTAAEMRAEAGFANQILAAFEVAGVERWDDSAVILRGRFKVAPLQQWGVRREYLRRLKRAFDEQGIEIPFPHLTIYPGVPKGGDAPAFQHRIAAGDV